MRIIVQFQGRGLKRWNSDPRVALFAPEIWEHLERIGTGAGNISFAGPFGIEYVLLPNGVGIGLICARPSIDRLIVIDIRVVG